MAIQKNSISELSTREEMLADEQFLSSLKARYLSEQQNYQELMRLKAAAESQLATMARLIKDTETFIAAKSGSTKEISTIRERVEIIDAVEGADSMVDVLAKGGYHNESPPRKRGRPKKTDIRTKPLAIEPDEHKPFSETDIIREHALRLLATAGRQLTGPEIRQMIEDSGYRFVSADPSELIKKALSPRRQPSITRPNQRGYWIKGVPLPGENASSASG